MDSDLTRLTVFFEAPFWVGVFERFEGGTLSVCKVTFGAEPKDYDAAGIAAAAGGAEAGTENAHPRTAGRGKAAEV